MISKHLKLTGIIHEVNHFNELMCLVEQEKTHIVIMNPALLPGGNAEKLKQTARLKNIPVMALVYAFFDECVLSQFDGQIYINDAGCAIREKIMAVLTRKKEEPAINNNQALTNREQDVLRCVALGFANKEISDELSISINTVITHRKNISNKLGVKSASGLTIYAVINNLINTEDYKLTK